VVDRGQPDRSSARVVVVVSRSRYRSRSWRGGFVAICIPIFLVGEISSLLDSCPECFSSDQNQSRFRSLNEFKVCNSSMQVRLRRKQQPHKDEVRQLSQPCQSSRLSTCSSDPALIPTLFRRPMVINYEDINQDALIRQTSNHTIPGTRRCLDGFHIIKRQFRLDLRWEQNIRL
jgi:hypothetical protein